MPSLVIRDSPLPFMDVVGAVSHSVVAVAVGTTSTGKPNIVGTGFALEFSEYFATCWHVASAHDSLLGLSPQELASKGLKDSKFRVALPGGGSYHWRELEEFTWLRGKYEKVDICIFRLIGIAIPPLTLHKGEFILGAEVGVLGFPLGNAMQGETLRPIITKTLLAGGMEPTPENHLDAGKAVLASSVATGFSGSPVFSASDGNVMGMVSSKPLEITPQGTWPAGLSLAVLPADLQQGLMSFVETSNRSIKDALRSSLDKKK